MNASNFLHRWIIHIDTSSGNENIGYLIADVIVVEGKQKPDIITQIVSIDSRDNSKLAI